MKGFTPIEKKSKKRNKKPLVVIKEEEYTPTELEMKIVEILTKKSPYSFTAESILKFIGSSSYRIDDVWNALDGIYLSQELTENNRHYKIKQ